MLSKNHLYVAVHVNITFHQKERCHDTESFRQSSHWKTLGFVAVKICFFQVVSLGCFPSHADSHHQDYYVFRRPGIQTNLPLVSWDRESSNPKVCPWFDHFTWGWFLAMSAKKLEATFKKMPTPSRSWTSWKRWKLQVQHWNNKPQRSWGRNSC